MPPNQTAKADRGRHPGFPGFSALAGGPGSLAAAFAGLGNAVLRPILTLTLTASLATMWCCFQASWRIGNEKAQSGDGGSRRGLWMPGLAIAVATTSGHNKGEC